MSELGEGRRPLEPPAVLARLEASRPGTHAGTVSAFDERAGLGTITWRIHDGTSDDRAPDEGAGEGGPVRRGAPDGGPREEGAGGVALDRTVPFHCTAIADGSRRIEPGTAVVFHLVARHGGRAEAAGITPRR